MTTSLEYAVERIASEWEAAWNTHDMSRMAKLLTVDADFVNVLGKHWKGVPEIERAHASMHKTQFRESIWTNKQVQVQLLHPGFALVHFGWSMRGDFNPDGTSRKPRSGVFSWLIVEALGTWRIRAAHNTTVVVLPPGLVAEGS